MGNFESLRVDIAVEDSARDGENAKALTDRVYSFTERELVARISAVRAEMETTA